MMVLVAFLGSVIRRLQSRFDMILVRRLSSGQGLVEYALLLMLIAIVVIGVLSMVGRTVSQTWYEKIVNGFPG